MKKILKEHFYLYLISHLKCYFKYTHIYANNPIKINIYIICRFDDHGQNRDAHTHFNNIHNMHARMIYTVLI